MMTRTMMPMEGIRKVEIRGMRMEVGTGKAARGMTMDMMAITMILMRVTKTVGIMARGMTGATGAETTRAVGIIQMAMTTQGVTIPAATMTREMIGTMETEIT